MKVHFPQSRVLISILALAASPVMAQDGDVAWVLSVHGPVEYREAAGEDFVTLRAETVLDGDDFIRTGSSGKVELLYMADNSILVIRSEQGLSVSSRQPNDVPRRSFFANFILRLTQRESDFNANAGTRGGSSIRSLAPNQSLVRNDDIELAWEGGAIGSDVKISLRGSRENVLAPESISQGAAVIDLRDLDAAPGETIRWEIAENQRTAATGHVTISTDAENTLLNQALDSLDQNPDRTTLSDASYHAQRALLLAKHGFLFEADSEMARAIEQTDEPRPYLRLREAIRQSPASGELLDVIFGTKSARTGEAFHRYGATAVLFEGDKVNLSCTAQGTCYVYVAFKPSKGAPYFLFPEHPAQPHNVPANSLLTLPYDQTGYPHWPLDDNAGEEIICVVASLSPLDQPQALLDALAKHGSALSAGHTRRETGDDTSEFYMFVIDHR